MSDKLPVPASGNNTFERIKRTNTQGGEFWSARELARVLEYADFRNILTVLEKAKEACLKSGHAVADHFVEITEMVGIGSGAQRPLEDWALSRYACYLVIQNADPSKPMVALGQNYFAVQTRRQELADEEAVKEDTMRLQLRAEMKKHNKNLAGAAKQAGVVQPVDYAIFMDHGYRGLYGGLSVREVHDRKRLKPKEQLLDHMGSRVAMAKANKRADLRKLMAYYAKAGFKEMSNSGRMAFDPHMINPLDKRKNFWGPAKIKCSEAMKVYQLPEPKDEE